MSALPQAAVFTGMGILSTTQEVAASALSLMPDAGGELVAEETLTLVAVLSARVCEVVAPREEALAASMLAAPFLYRDWLVGASMVEARKSNLVREGVEIGRRLEKKAAFYTAHLQGGLIPARSSLENVLLMWMGRISPPRMPESPEKRLAELPVLDRLQTHVRVIAAQLKHAFPPPTDE